MRVVPLIDAPTLHGQYLPGINLGDEQMPVSNTDVVKDLSTQCEGWQIGAVGEYGWEAVPGQGAQ